MSDYMVINKIKNEMAEFGLNKNLIDNILDIIYFIGVGQNVAWREDGVEMHENNSHPEECIYEVSLGNHSGPYGYTISMSDIMKLYAILPRRT